MNDKKNEVPYSRNDEIDLYDLYLVLKKRFKLIAGIVVSTTLIIGIISFFMPPVYRSSFIVRIFNTSATEKNPIISTGEVEKIISELDLLRKEKQWNELSKRLTIDSDKIKKVVKFDAKTPRDAKDLVEITVDVYDRGLIPDLKNGIVQYLNQNPYVNKRIAMWKDSNLYQKAEIQEKIQEIDEFKNFVIVQIKKDRAKYLGFNPLQLDEEVINFKQRVRDLENSIKLLRGFEVTVEPVIPNKPIKPNVMSIILATLVIALFIGVAITFLIERHEREKATK
jgi:capsular polysaccharide biosynthesis protein